MVAATCARRAAGPGPWHARQVLAGLVLAIALLLAGCGPNRQKAMALADQAQQQFDAGDVRDASMTIDRAIREQDDVADLYLLKARIALAEDRLADVFLAYTQAVELEPSNVDALRGLAQIAFQIGRTEDAERTVTQLLAQSPADPTARMIEGLLALARCRPQAALDLAEQILANNAADEGGMVLRIRALFALGRDGEARAALDEAIRRFGNSYGLLLTRLEMDRTLADAPALKADFVALRQLRPRNADLAVQQVNFLYKTGDIVAARREGLGLLRSGILQGEGLDRMARLWREYDAAPLSPAELAALVARGPRPVRIMAARHYLELGQGAPALALLAGLDGSDVAGLTGRAELLAGKRDQAEATARSVLARDKTQCEALLALAGAHLAAGRREEASVRAEDAAAECPRQWPAYVVMADANAGSVPQLDRITAAALDADPQNGALARALAQRWLSRGQIDRAMAVARRVTRSAPALVSGWVLLQELCGRSGDPVCTGDAARGLDLARKLYAIDPPAGQLPLLGGGGIGCRAAGSPASAQVSRKRSSTAAI